MSTSDEFALLDSPLIRAIYNELQEVKTLMSDIHSTGRDVEAKVQSILDADLPGALQRIQEDFDTLRNQLSNAGLDQAALNSASAKLDQLKSDLQGIDPDPNNPAPAQPPADQPPAQPPPSQG